MRPKKVILCVDDNEQELSVLKFTLETNGYRVLAALSGQEAIAVFSTSPQIDLVLADTHMPQMSGIQLAERLKRMRSHVPMLLLGDAQAAGGEIHVADAVMARKNCTSFELLERVKLMSARKRGPRKGAHRIVQDEVLAAAS
jgi:CheY-like chemotaxis protein